MEEAGNIVMVSASAAKLTDIGRDKQDVLAQQMAEPRLLFREKAQEAAIDKHFPEIRMAQRITHSVGIDATARGSASSERRLYMIDSVKAAN